MKSFMVLTIPVLEYFTRFLYSPRHRAHSLRVLTIFVFHYAGRLTDKYGNLAQWWTEDEIIAYENKTKCFVDQYSKFVVPVAADLNQTTVYSVKSFTWYSVGGTPSTLFIVLLYPYFRRWMGCIRWVKILPITAACGRLSSRIRNTYERTAKKNR